MKNKLRKYLQSLEAGEPIDWPGLRHLLIKCNVNPSTIDEIFRPAREGNEWRVTAKNQAAYNALLDHLGITADLSTRASAARHGRSHDVSVSGNVVIVKNPAFSYSVAYECDAQGNWVFPAETASELVIVENLECYLQRDRLMPFLSARCGLMLDPKGVDIAYASGNAITKACNRSWLERYASIHCVLDVDAGGLRIFTSLNRLLDDSGPELMYVIPKNLPELLETTQRMMDERERTSVAAYMDMEAPVGLIARTLLNAGKTIEQEVYLDESI